MSPERPILRADMHVHSWHSTQNGDLPFLKSRDCYSDPVAVYRTAKARGMDVVTITDHDSIGGCLELLDRLPDVSDFVMGEEVSCWFPDSGIEVHLGVYGITETLHHELQPLRRNVFDVIGRLREADVLFVLNHLLHFYRGQIPLESYMRLLSEVPAVEVRNGTMVPAHNVLIERIVQRMCGRSNDAVLPAMIGGSDAHTLRRVGRTWTEAPARNAAEFIAAVRKGLARPGGAHGGANAVAGDAYGVILRYYGSLFGIGPSDHAPLHRAGCLAFSIAALPGQFLPWLIPALGKRRESRIVADAAAALEPWLQGFAVDAGDLVAIPEEQA